MCLLLLGLGSVEVEWGTTFFFLFLMQILSMHFCLSVFFLPYSGLSLQYMQTLHLSLIFNEHGLQQIRLDTFLEISFSTWVDSAIGTTSENPSILEFSKISLSTIVD